MIETGDVPGIILLVCTLVYACGELSEGVMRPTDHCERVSRIWWTARREVINSPPGSGIASPSAMYMYDTFLFHHQCVALSGHNNVYVPYRTGWDQYI